VIEFRLDPGSGVPTYLQLVRQVKQAMRLGLLEPGDRLPTVREVVARLAVNPNTVSKAYRELEREGLTGGRPGQGTFVLRSLAGPSLKRHAALRRGLVRWLASARAAGLDEESIAALISDTVRATARASDKEATG
jgi:GntR family transcriptional regulator